MISFTYMSYMYKSCLCYTCGYVTHGSGGETHGLDGRTARTSAQLGCSWCTAWSGRVCAWTRPRFGRDARIGCTRAKLYGYDWVMWLIYRNVHMQLKVKGMQLKVSMQKNIGERGSTRAIYVHSLFSSFFLGGTLFLATLFIFLMRGKQSLILVSKREKLITCW